MGMHGPLGRRHLLALVPVLGLTALGAGFWQMLHGMGSGRFDPHAVSTPLLGKTVPDFPALPGLPGLGAGFDVAELRAQKTPVLVNFMASWCIPCVEEMAELHVLSSTLPVWGIAYKDHPARTAAFVVRNGRPYSRIASDQSGRTAIEWGVTGVPESFLVMPGGRIVWHGSSALDAETFKREILPLLASDGHTDATQKEPRGQDSQEKAP